MNGTQRDPALQEAIDLVGGIAALTAFMNRELQASGEPKITEQAVSQWRRCPPARVLLVERATFDPQTGQARVTRHRLAPKFYPLDQVAA